MPNISIIIPFHSNKNYLFTCLSSIKPYVGDDVEIIVVQNNEKEDDLVTLDSDPKIESIYIYKSIGYSTACNIGAARARGEYLCFCDADAISITPNWWMAHIEEFRRNSAVGITSSLLVDGRTNRVQDFGIGWSGYNHFHPCYGAKLDDPRLAKSRQVQMACSAQMTIRRDVFMTLGQFDETLKYHYQDVDLCIRLKSLRLSVFAVAQSKAYHKNQSAQVNRSPYKIDERGYYTAKNRDNLTTDIADYVIESVSILSEKNQLTALYSVLDLSTIYDSQEIVKALGREIRSRPLLERHMPERDPWHINLFEVLGRELARHPQPFLFLVDSIYSLQHNSLWFSLRGHNLDIAIDRHGNAALVPGLQENL